MHAFGIDGFLVNYGMFLSPDSNVQYNNIWIRWGKKYFWEINYIDWGFEDKYAKPGDFLNWNPIQAILLSIFRFDNSYQ